MGYSSLDWVFATSSDTWSEDCTIFTKPTCCFIDIYWTLLNKVFVLTGFVLTESGSSWRFKQFAGTVVRKLEKKKIVPHLTRWLGVMILLQNMSIQSSLLCWRLCCSRYNQTIQPSKSNEICWECDMFWKNRRVCRCSLWWACVSKRLPFSPIYI